MSKGIAIESQVKRSIEKGDYGLNSTVMLMVKGLLYTNWITEASEGFDRDENKCHYFGNTDCDLAKNDVLDNWGPKALCDEFFPRPRVHFDHPGEPIFKIPTPILLKPDDRTRVGIDALNTIQTTMSNDLKSCHCSIVLENMATNCTIDAIALMQIYQKTLLCTPKSVLVKEFIVGIETKFGTTKCDGDPHIIVNGDVAEKVKKQHFKIDFTVFLKDDEKKEVLKCDSPDPLAFSPQNSPEIPPLRISNDDDGDVQNKNRRAQLASKTIYDVLSNPFEPHIQSKIMEPTGELLDHSLPYPDLYLAFVDNMVEINIIKLYNAIGLISPLAQDWIGELHKKAKCNDPHVSIRMVKEEKVLLPNDWTLSNLNDDVCVKFDSITRRWMRIRLGLPLEIKQSGLKRRRGDDYSNDLIDNSSNFKKRRTMNEIGLMFLTRDLD